jgi:phage terminase large subunit
MENQAQEQALLDFALSAKNARVPEDQLRNFLKRGYVPLPWQLGFHATARECDLDGGPVKLGVGGARGPGKSHGVFAQITLDDCERVPGLKCLFIRKTGIAAKESFEDLIDKVLRGKAEYEYNRSTNTLHFANNSHVLLGGFRDERDIDNYVGIEYDLIAIEELNQLDKTRVQKLLGSMRTSKPNWRPRLYASFNPGGKGHEDVKQMFVVPFREDRQTETRFVPSTYKENPYLNKEYLQYLEGLDGNLGKAWRDGDFDIFEGQYFNEWSQERHVVSPYAIPPSWKRVRSIDHGRTAPTACLWGAIDQDGKLHVYREYYMAGVDADLNAQKIAELSKGETYAFTILDSACFSKTGNGETIADIYEKNGVTCEPATKNRLAGWVLVHEYLRGDPVRMSDGTTEVQPRAVFFKTCTNIIRTLPTLIHDERNPEDVDSDGEDHAPDALSYLLQALHESKSPPAKTTLEKKLEELKKGAVLSPGQLNRFYSRRK